jgi:hypothetical protein
MKPNQSIHVTIRQPPNPEPVRSLGILGSELGADTITTLVSRFLVNEPTYKDPEFLQNVKDEVLKALASGNVISVIREGSLTHITIDQN